MVEPLRHRQTKGAGTDMLSLTSPRHISTLPTPAAQPQSIAIKEIQRGTIDLQPLRLNSLPGFTALGLRKPLHGEAARTINGVLYPVERDDISKFDARGWLCPR